MRLANGGARDKLKVAILFGLKFCGAFALSHALMRHSLRILCYHGISLSDEHLFRQRLFMRSETFRRRMEYLRGAGYLVLPLAQALDQLRDGTLPASTAVITIDDGWYGSLRGAFPVLHDLGLAATLYVTTYYVFQRAPVFDVVIAYLLWKTDATTLELDGLHQGLSGRLDLSSEAARERAADFLVGHGNTNLSGDERIEMTCLLAARLGLDYEDVAEKRLFQLMTPEDLLELAAQGVDVQLHTHRHTFDVADRERAHSEIQENRAKLEPLVGKRLDHFCYPSGVYHPRVWPWLEEMGIRSATTTAVGFCRRETPRYALPRIVDGENVSDIEFEAEMTGTLEIIRRARAWLSGQFLNGWRRKQVEP